ncbi:MAG: hypothetical protein KDB04_06165 [Acidimicrobiales bacterium]|nr:hypothetical protein [Acidimicrobiales bacterium]
MPDDGGGPIARRRATDRPPDGPGAFPLPLVVAGFGGLALVRVLPYLLGGPGFFVDDWRNLARLDTVGWLRSAEASRFASRPGAWAVETVLYPVLRDHPVWWVIVLAALATAVAAVLYLLLCRFTTPVVALAVVTLWLLLPNHTSLRTFANTAPMTVGLLLLVVSIVLMDDGRLVLGALVAAAGGLCYEVMLIPALGALVAIHLWRGEGTRRAASRAAGVVVVTGLLMLIHPTYRPGSAHRGSPAVIPAAHFASGLTPDPTIARILAATSVLGIGLGVARYAKGDREVGGGPWLIVCGLATIALGVAAFALKWPTEVRGQADRSFVVSSVGAALAWVGIARVLLERSRGALGAAALALLVVLASANATYQRDWVESAQGARQMLEGVQCRFGDEVPVDLGVGPQVPSPGGVRSLHQFFLADASRVTLGRPLTFDLVETEEAWRDRPANRQLTWDELIATRCDR